MMIYIQTHCWHDRRYPNTLHQSFLSESWVKRPIESVVHPETLFCHVLLLESIGYVRSQHVSAYWFCCCKDLIPAISCDVGGVIIVLSIFSRDKQSWVIFAIWRAWFWNTTSKVPMSREILTRNPVTHKVEVQTSCFRIRQNSAVITLWDVFLTPIAFSLLLVFWNKSNKEIVFWINMHVERVVNISWTYFE